MRKGIWQKVLLWTEIGAYITLLIITLKHQQPPLFDEVGFVKNVILFRELGLSEEFLLTMTNQAPGPLYQLVHYPLSPLTHLEAPGIRLVNVALLGLLIGMMAFIIKRFMNRSFSTSMVWAGSMMAVPMVWQVSGLALSEIPAMFFAVASVWALWHAVEAEGRNTGKSISMAALAGILLGVTILGRSPFLLLSLAGTALLWGNFSNKARWKTFLLYAAIGLGMAIPVFMTWKGLVPPHQKAVNTGGLSLWHGILAFAYAGLFMLLVAPGWFYRGKLIIIGLVIFYVGFFFVNQNFLGYTYYPLSEALKRVAPAGFMKVYPYLVSPLLASFALYFVGSSLARAWERRQQPVFLFLLLGGMLLLASSFSITHLFSTRYVAQAAPFLVLAAVDYDEAGKYRWLRCIVGISIGILSLETYFQFQ